MEAALRFDVVLVDRPLLDALGYLLAALESSGRNVEKPRLEELTQIAQAHQSRYDWFAATVLDEAIALGPDRDRNEGFRRLAGETIGRLAKAHVPNARLLTIADASSLIDEVIELTMQRHAR